ncbi:MAG TPA: gamma-glutamyltransferase family protein, partial [bacterium]
MPRTLAVLCLSAWALAATGHAQTAADPESSPGPLRQIAPVEFPHAMVVAAHPLAAQAGVEVLRAGGNAIDAAVATAYALNVVEPQSSGIGGGLFLIAYLAATGQVVALDGREEAPAAVTPDWFLRPNGTPVPFFPDRITGGRAVGVPGAVRALEKARAMFGKLPRNTDLAPAIRLATDGFPAGARVAGQLELHAKRMVQFPATRAAFFPDGEHPVRQGERLRQPDLARTLRLIAEQGDAVFYEGEIARDIVRAVNEAPVHPGRMTLADLAQYQAPLRAPAVSTFRGYTIYGMGPPSSGGVTVQQILAIVGRWSPRPEPLEPALAIHRFAQASRLAFADRNAYLADPDFVAVPLPGLLSPDYLRQRADSLDWRQPLASPLPGKPLGAPTAQQVSEDTEHWSTSHLVVVDAERNMVSLTTTIEQGF